MHVYGKLEGASPLPPDGDVRENEGSADIIDVVGTFDEIEQSENVTTGEGIIRISNENSLIWVYAELNGQTISSMIDSGANPNCIAMTCLQGSPHLK